ncbi:MAG: hypothetical protein AMXMBFR64_10420 [Myxococcales bacterium]
MNRLTASTALIIDGMARDDLEVYAAAVGVDPGRPDLGSAVLARIADPGWVLTAARSLPVAARRALAVAAWACPDTVAPLPLFEDATGAASPGDLADLDASGLWLGEPSFEAGGPSRRLVPQVTSAVVRAHLARSVGVSVRLASTAPSLEPGARLIRCLAALSDVGARLRKDGGVVRTCASRIADRLPGFDPAGADDVSLGLLAGVALRAGWLGWSGDRLRLDASALAEGAPTRRELIAVVVSALIAAVPPLGPALAALTSLPELTAVPLSIYDGILSISYDPRVHALDPAAPASPPPVRDAVGLLALVGVVLVARHGEDLYVLLHPEARATLRGERRLASVSSPVVQGGREVQFPPDCQAEAYLRVASLCACASFGDVDRWTLDAARLQAALDGGLDPAQARRWVEDCCPDEDLTVVTAWLEGARGPDDLCEVLAGVPVRLGAHALAELVADPELGPLVLERHGPLAVLHPQALPLLTGWARGRGVRLTGERQAHPAALPAPSRRLDWRPLPERLAALLADLLEPADGVSFLPGCEDLVYPPLLALGADDAAAEAAERLVTTLLVRAPRALPPPPPTPDPRAGRAAWDDAPPSWRRLSHALSVDLPALLRVAAEAGLRVEVHVALGGRRVVPRTFVPAALEPVGAPLSVFPRDEPAPIRLRDIRAVRLLEPLVSPRPSVAAPRAGAPPPAEALRPD